MAAAYNYGPTTDLMIGIGTRLELPTMSRWPYRPEGLKSIRIDIDPTEMRRYAPDTAVIAMPRPAPPTWSLRSGRPATAGPAAGARQSRSHGRGHQEIQKIQPQMAYLNILREVLPANAIVTDELSQVASPPGTVFRSMSRAPSSPRAIRARSAPLPTALGAKVAHPDRPVVAITGDGGFMFGVQELSTAVQFKIGVVTLVFNNNAYGNVRRDQRERFDGAWWRPTFVNPDFVKLAESFGVGAARVTSRIISAPRWKRRWPMAGPT